MTPAADSLWGRSVFPPSEKETDATLAVFCGVFGRRWVENAIESLERQSNITAQVVMAVNGPDEEIVTRLRRYQDSSRHGVWIVVNHANLGPTGSYYRNRDLITGAWTAFMHQDDVYLAAHLSTLRSMALSTDEATLGLFTSLGGISEDGRRRASPPPIMNRHIRRQPPWVTLPEIFKRHPFPTPAMAIRSDADVPDLAWYDSGAPDSEWFARLACRGTLDATDDVTVLYRQPAEGESSATDWSTRAWLWSVSIERVISSPEFARLLKVIPESERSSFASAFLNAIPARYPASAIFRYLQFLAAQRMCDAWAYRNQEAIDFVAGFLSPWGQSASVRSLQALGADTSSASSHPEVEVLLGVPPNQTIIERLGRSSYRRYAHRLPEGLRNRSVKFYRALRRGAS